MCHFYETMLNTSPSKFETLFLPMLATSYLSIGLTISIYMILYFYTPDNWYTLIKSAGDASGVLNN